MRLSRCIRPLASAMLVMVIALATTFTSTQSARAAGPLTVYPLCESTGVGHFYCDAVASGGAGSYSYSWSAYSERWGSPGTVVLNTTSGSLIMGICLPGYFTYITVTATDSAGATASLTGVFECYRGGAYPF